MLGIQVWKKQVCKEVEMLPERIIPNVLAAFCVVVLIGVGLWPTSPPPL